ncbi:MAG: HIT family protein [Candidatus Hermodarchaeota archaeon]
MEKCIFCSIVKGLAPASIVYSDESVIGIMDIQPVNPGHLLIIPKVHAAQLSDLNKEIGAHMFQIAMHTAKALRNSNIKCEGINFWLADGKVAFQEIPHIHLHIIPRFKGDGLMITFGSTYGSRPDRKELDQIAEDIRKNME